MTRTDLSLLRRWIAARVRITLRVPRATFFTFIFPLMFLVLFNAINGDAQVAATSPAGGDVPFAQFYTPSIGIFGLTLACYTTVIFGLAYGGVMPLYAVLARAYFPSREGDGLGVHLRAHQRQGVDHRMVIARRRVSEAESRLANRQLLGRRGGQVAA